ncbi:MAG: hypothetical protein ACYDA1_00340 [Vulcanimicrobiaceae bacterium]
MLAVRGLVAGIIIVLGATLTVRIIAAANGRYGLILPGVALGILLMLFGSYRLMQILRARQAP